MFYLDTGARKWGEPYLTREFSSLIAESNARKAFVDDCRRTGGRRRQPADRRGAKFHVGGDTLYGRYWGCTEDVRFLHFEDLLSSGN